MNLAINTDFAGESCKIEDLELGLRAIAEAGFTHIHWCHEWEGDYLYDPAEMLQIREWMDTFGLKAKALHASRGSFRPYGGTLDGHYRKDYTSVVEYNRAAGAGQIRNRVDLARVLGAEEIVLHMYLPYCEFEKSPEFKEVFYRQVYRSLDELMPYCLERGIRICIENLIEASGELQKEQFTRLLERYPSEFLGVCLDTGHGYLVWGEKFIEKFAVPFRDRIHSVHLNDNSGRKPEPGLGDVHLLPGEGRIPWKKLTEVLQASVYKQPFVLEVNKPAGEENRHFLNRALHAGHTLI